MVNSAFYNLGLSTGQWPGSALEPASRDFQRRQHSCRQDGGDQFAVRHFRVVGPDVSLSSGDGSS
jgi:hypothetical protein